MGSRETLDVTLVEPELVVEVGVDVPMDATGPGCFGRHLVQDLSIDVQVEVHASGKTVTAVVPCPACGRPQAEEQD